MRTNSACLCVAIVSSVARADLHTVYEGRLFLDPSGTYILEGQVDLDAYRSGFADVLRNYEPWFDRADEIASGITGASGLRFSTEPLDDAGNFGEIGDTVQFNPLATGGTQDIATGGDYIDKQLNQQITNFEVASVDVETEVFKQEFGPVQSNRRTLRGGGIEDETFSFSFLALNAWDIGWLETDQDGFTQAVTIKIGTVPAPSSVIGLFVGLGVVSRRRRSSGVS